ncbi:MAG: peptidoglycan-binding domain-containing protein [Bacilli bacterium]
MKKNLLISLTALTLVSSMISPLVAYADQPGDPTDISIVEQVKDGASGQVSIYDSVKRAVVTYYVSFRNDIISISGTDGTNFSFNITNRSSYVGYNFTTKGNPVKAAQILLNVFKHKTGNGTSLQVDSLFGPSTHSMVQVFQKYSNLSVDATVGPNTWRKLCSYL